MKLNMGGEERKGKGRRIFCHWKVEQAFNRDKFLSCELVVAIMVCL